MNEREMEKCCSLFADRLENAINHDRTDLQKQLTELAEAALRWAYADDIVAAHGWDYTYTDVDGNDQHIDDDWDAAKRQVVELSTAIVPRDRQDQMAMEFKNHHKEA